MLTSRTCRFAHQQHHINMVRAIVDKNLSARMRRIRKTDTKPELAVRRLVHKMGYRFRLHKQGLPGTPDLVFSGMRKVIFVHGCFWHQHDCRLGAKQPSVNQTYWGPKLMRNIERDKDNIKQLIAAGWDVLVVWECQTQIPESLLSIVNEFLDTPK